MYAKDIKQPLNPYILIILAIENLSTKTLQKKANKISGIPITENPNNHIKKIKIDWLIEAFFKVIT